MVARPPVGVDHHPREYESPDVQSRASIPVRWQCPNHVTNGCLRAAFVPGDDLVSALLVGMQISDSIELQVTAGDASREYLYSYEATCKQVTRHSPRSWLTHRTASPSTKATES